MTKIHSDILKTRLGDLVDIAVVFRHKYTSRGLNDNKSKRAAYTYDYYLLNWSNPKAKELLNHYYNYSLEYRIEKLREEESFVRRAKMAEEVGKLTLKRKEQEIEEHFTERKEQIEQLNKEINEINTRIVKESQNQHNHYVEFLTELVRIYRREEELRIQHVKDEENVNYKADKSILELKAFLNVFIMLKVKNLLYNRGYSYTDIWEIMDKRGLLPEHLKEKSTTSS